MTPDAPPHDTALTDTDIDRALDAIRAGRADEGRGILDSLLERSPDDTAVLGNSAFLALNERRWADAANLYGRMGSTAGGDVSYFHAWAFAAIGLYVEALSMCRAALDRVSDDPWNTEIRVLGGACALRLRDAGAALELVDPLVLSADAAKVAAGLPVHTVAAFLARVASAGGGIPVAVHATIPPDGLSVGRPLSPRWLAGVAGRVVGALPDSWLSQGARASRVRLGLRMWSASHSAGTSFTAPVPVATDAASLEAYGLTLDAILDETFQIPRADIPAVLRTSIRAEDALALHAWTSARRPGTFVHVGVFVGFSACVSALAMCQGKAYGSGTRGRLVAVDPFIAYPQLDPCAFFGRVSARLGLDDIIEVRRGFYNHTSFDCPTGALPDFPEVVGRRVLAEHRGADAFLIDGDHSSPGVVADLMLSLEHLRPGGSVLVHDVRSIGSVRREIALLLDDHTLGQRLTYGELAPFNTDGIGVLEWRIPPMRPGGAV